jgi:hypothetical protein
LLFLRLRAASEASLCDRLHCGCGGNLDTFSWNNRGTAKAKLGDRDGAIADLKEALALSPNSEEIKDRLKALRAAS